MLHVTNIMKRRVTILVAFAVHVCNPVEKIILKAVAFLG